MKQILAESIEELMQKTSVKRITVKDIVTNCNTTSQTFYNNFKDKYELIFWVYQVQMDILINRIGNNYNWRQMTTEILKLFIRKKTFFINALKNTQGQNSFNEYGFHHTLSASIAVIKKLHGIQVIDDDLIFALKLYIHGSTKMVEEWTINGMKQTPEQMAQNLTDSMPNSVRKYLLPKD